MEPIHDIERIALLREPVRRDLYFHVREAGHPISREEAADAVGVSKSLAAFHLDRLADAGLLEVEYRRLTGKTGRGAGRPAKLYRPSARRVSVSFPPTRYELAGELLMEALEAKRPEDTPEDAVRHAAHLHAGRLADRLRPTLRRRSGYGRVGEFLERLGFEPEEGRREILLRNCPFHELVERHPQLVCGLNESFMEGITERLAGDEAAALPCDLEGYCCVLIQKND